jgi:hypothetical protein
MGQFFFLLFWEFYLTANYAKCFPAPVDFRRNSTFSIYNSHPDLRQPMVSLYSQDKPGHLFDNPGYGFDGRRSYDLLYRQGLTLQQ